MYFKRFNLVFLVFAIFCSCQKSSLVPTKVQEVQQLDNVIAQRSATSLLTSSEKADLWKNHLQSEITKYGDDNKRSFISNVLSIIEPAMFDETTKHNFDGTLAILNFKASKLFSQDESYFLFNSLGKAGVAINSASAPPTGCTCNSSQINTCTAHWAGGYTYCQKGASSCKTSESGCGWFWLNQCNGDCVTVLTI